MPQCGAEGQRVCWGAVKFDGWRREDWEFLHNGSGACDRSLIITDGTWDATCKDGDTANINRHAFSESNPWVTWALDNQLYNQNLDEPVNWAPRMMAHNAFNSWKEGYMFPNQWYSIYDQLEAGARAVELDTHWYNDAVRLGHGSAIATDRMYAYGIREIADWLDDHPEAFVVVYLEDNVGAGHAGAVSAPIEAFLGDRVLRTGEKPAGRWPTLREMRAGDRHKQVLFIGAGSAGKYGDWAFNASPGYKSAWPRNFDAAACTGDGSNLLERGEGWTRMYEDRVSLDAAGLPEAPLSYWAGLLNESLSESLVPDHWTADHVKAHVRTVGQVADCGVALTALDFFAAANHTIAGELERQGEADKRREAAVWSWAAGDWGTGNAAMLHASDGRWHSATGSEATRFACARPREGDAKEWGDKLGQDWRVTSATGAWTEGWAKCAAEYGTEGFVFAAPASGYQNKQLRAAAGGNNVWLNYHKVDNAWRVNHRPAVTGSVPTGQTLAEGHTISFATTASDLDGDALTFAWSFGDGTTGTGARPNHVYADNGTYTVVVTASDPYGAFRSHTFQVAITNVAPTVTAGADRSVDEGATLTLAPASFNDRGTLDTHTATIDWGDGTPIVRGAVTEAPFGPPGSTAGASGTVGGSHVYGDNGRYTATVCVTDDEGATGCDSLAVTVGNVAPTQALDTAPAIAFGDGPAFLGRVGVEQVFNAAAGDPGSDDLTFTWTFTDTVTGATATIAQPHYNNGASRDPLPSPLGAHPFAVDPDTARRTFTTPSLYTVQVRVADDDGGQATAQSLPLLMTGNRSCTQPAAFWWQQFNPKMKRQLDDGTLRGYLAIAGYGSRVFSEQIPTSTLAEAEAVLRPGGQGLDSHEPTVLRALATQQVFAAWLNFASGGVRWGQNVPRGGTFGAEIARAEAILLDPHATRDDYRTAFRIAESINIMAAGRAACG